LSGRLVEQVGTPFLVPNGALVPIEQLSLSSELDGGHGTNRALRTRPQIGAQDDVDAIRARLAHFVDTKATFDTYHKESERVLL
jgi:integrase/recombinase XerD